MVFNWEIFTEINQKSSQKYGLLAVVDGHKTVCTHKKDFLQQLYSNTQSFAAFLELKVSDGPGLH